MTIADYIAIGVLIVLGIFAITAVSGAWYAHLWIPASSLDHLG